MTIKNNTTTDHILLLIILIVAATLRFWNFSEIPFVPDELSVVERTKFSNFHDEIKYGVETDAHPAGGILFVLYWAKLFGTSEIAIKFPFIIFGLLSILITYKISEKWFNSSVGLIVAAFMACMQYMVMYSQSSRPYMSGVFFSLLMVWYWSNYLFDPASANKNKWLLGYIITAALGAYTHHFALLFAIIVGLSGIFFITKNTWKGYILAGIMIFILYIPHLGISLFQLSEGGLGGPDGWLGKPGNNWLSNYLKYVFHYSYWMYGLLFTLLLLSIYYKSAVLESKNKLRFVFLIWFALLFFIEYYYSLWVNPVIQFSSLIFAFPFLLIFLFSAFAELNRAMKITIVLAILITGTSTLVFSRKHFQVFYKQTFQEQITATYKCLDLIKNEKNVTIKLSIPPYPRDYYFKKYNRKFESADFDPYIDKPDTKAMRKFVGELNTEYFIAGNLPAEYILIIKEKYPYLIFKEEGCSFTIRCFSKEKKLPEVHDQIFMRKTLIGDKSSSIDSLAEFGQAYTFKLTNYFHDRHTIANLSVDIFPSDSSDDPVLVFNIDDNGKSISWNGSNYSNYNINMGSFNRIYLSVDLTSINLKDHPEAEAKIYVWNRNKKKIAVKNLNLEFIEGNHLNYSLYEPID